MMTSGIDDRRREEQAIGDFLTWARWQGLRMMRELKTPGGGVRTVEVPTAEVKAWYSHRDVDDDGRLSDGHARVRALARAWRSAGCRHHRCAVPSVAVTGINAETRLVIDYLSACDPYPSGTRVEHGGLPGVVTGRTGLDEWTIDLGDGETVAVGHTVLLPAPCLSGRGCVGPP